jgi:multidrug resistance efflux pump
MMGERALLPMAAPDDLLGRALEDWRSRLAGAGVLCRDVAFQADEGPWVRGFSDAEAALQAVWATTRARVAQDNPVALAKLDGRPGADLLMAVALRLPSGPSGVLGLVLPPPHNERMVQMVMLSLGGLQLALSAASLAHNERAAFLLELLGHVGSQTQARAAAQEWINRSAAWARAAAPALASGLTLSLFEIRRGLPRWWVAADTAWAEESSPEVRQASELASRAMVQADEVLDGPWWALPVLADGEPVAVLVARQAHSPADWPPELLDPLRSSATLAEPLLRQWRLAERGLPRHAWDSLRESWRKLRGPGHLLWKAGAVATAVVLVGLLLVPVEERISAATVIEGQTRQVVTAPFEGFIAAVAVRPGEQVRAGQLLAHLDDRELKLEQERWRSERDQAAGKLREAMAERDAPKVAASSAELRQAEAQLALVEAKLQRAALLAPQDGLVVSGDWAQQIGGPVEAGKEMFEVATTDNFRVVLHVADRDIARVQVGQLGSLRLTGQPQATHEFRVTRLTATASVQDGNNGFRVEAAWLGAVPPLTPGMQGVGKVAVGRANLLTVWTRPSIDWLRLKWWGWWW